MAMDIRFAELNDYSSISQLFAEGDIYHAHALPERFQSIHPARSEVYFTNVINQLNRYIVVIEEAQVVIGLIEFRVVTVDEQLPVVGRRFVSIESLIVTRAYQQRGVGRRLMQHVENWATTYSIPTIELNVYAFNRNAIRLYEELGYTVLSQRMTKQVQVD